MSSPDLQLFVDAQFLSPYAMSAFVGLREKGLPFTVTEVDLGARQNTQPAYRARSLTCRVPTLAHGDLSLSESSAITEYLDEVFSPPSYAALYPQDPKARARARQLQAWLRSDLMPIREERPTTVIFRQPNPQPLSEQARVAAQKLFDLAETLLAPGAIALFGQWCIADTDLALMLNRLLANGDPLPERLAEYVRQQWQRPSVQAWIEQSRSKA
jgi:glutathione S-transferase